MAESLKGKVAVITGVGSGFAKATAELFATVDQVGLVLIDINEKALEATADVLQGGRLEGRCLCGRRDQGGDLRARAQGNARYLSARSISSSITRAARSKWRPSRRWMMTSTAASLT